MANQLAALGNEAHIYQVNERFPPGRPTVDHWLTIG